MSMCVKSPELPVFVAGIVLRRSGMELECSGCARVAGDCRAGWVSG